MSYPRGYEGKVQAKYLPPSTVIGNGRDVIPAKTPCYPGFKDMNKVYRVPQMSELINLNPSSRKVLGCVNLNSYVIKPKDRLNLSTMPISPVSAHYGHVVNPGKYIPRRGVIASQQSTLSRRMGITA
jgi:hypothetical protein